MTPVTSTCNDRRRRTFRGGVHYRGPCRSDYDRQDPRLEPDWPSESKYGFKQAVCRRIDRIHHDRNRDFVPLLKRREGEEHKTRKNPSRSSGWVRALKFLVTRWDPKTMEVGFWDEQAGAVGRHLTLEEWDRALGQSPWATERGLADLVNANLIVRHPAVDEKGEPIRGAPAVTKATYDLFRLLGYTEAEIKRVREDAGWSSTRKRRQRARTAKLSPATAEVVEKFPAMAPVMATLAPDQLSDADALGVNNLMGRLRQMFPDLPGDRIRAEALKIFRQRQQPPRPRPPPKR